MTISVIVIFIFSYSFVVMDTRNIHHPYRDGFSYLCMFSKPQNMIFVVDCMEKWLSGHVSV